MNPQVGIIFGSKTDWPIVEHATQKLDFFGVPYEALSLSAHRTPDAVTDYAKNAESRGIKIIIAAAGMAAHLAGVIAANTIIPVLGVPMPSEPLNGMDALLATVQMPAGIPVGTLAIGKAGAINAALLAVSILSIHYPEYRKKLHDFRKEQTEKILESRNIIY